ncbi:MULTISPECIES: BppU family phage baseplate upper protein [Bacillus cereus group]|uniref:BppU N-terminal domain-containing protein n=1 Tax=Bacillus cereus VD048 TaxID=1053226 RepID=J8HHP5_BACCE|nr:MULTISPECIES: BppU family phage baseplate upper protein [Bacillus cereus group]EJR32657.1 hypothetical protein IIG_02509 [Bacillus cereus VD048]WJE37043.1 BppU family phage baseplate upper protein [Bacillus mycoides]
MKTKLILDINKTQYAQLNSIVTGRVGDKVSNVADVYLIDSGSPYNLTGSKVFFECVKPDNTVVRDDNGVKIIDAAKGHFEYTFPTETFGAIGKAKQAFMSIEKDKTVRATTQDFVLVTLPDAMTNRVPSESYISDLEKLIKELNEMALEEINSQAAAEASAAKEFAEKANGLSNSTQKQLDEIVIKGDSSVEAAQARIDEKGVVHPTLKVRIDYESEKIEVLNDKIGKLFVTYSDFGAKLDGVTDDTKAIKDAHSYANSKGIPVVQRESKFVLNGQINVMTDTDLTGSVVKTSWLHDVYEYSRTNILYNIVGADLINITSSVNQAEFSKGALEIPSLAKVESSCVVIESTATDFMRNDGGNIATVYKSEANMIMKNDTGTLVYPLTKDYTSATGFKVSIRALENNLTFKAPTLELINAGISSFIKTSRNNITIEGGLVREVSNLTDYKAPMYSFVRGEKCCNISISNVIAPVVGRQNKTGEYGLGYFLIFDRACGMYIDKAEQQSGWSSVNGNYMRDIRVKNSKLIYVGGHANIYDLFVRDTYVSSKISAHGGGLMEVTNCTIVGSRTSPAVETRLDYAGEWDGTIRITNSKTLLSPRILTMNLVNYDCGRKVVLPNVEVFNCTLENFRGDIVKAVEFRGWTGNFASTLPSFTFNGVIMKTKNDNVLNLITMPEITNTAVSGEIKIVADNIRPDEGSYMPNIYTGARANFLIPKITNPNVKVKFDVRNSIANFSVSGTSNVEATVRNSDAYILRATTGASDITTVGEPLSIVYDNCNLYRLPSDLGSMTNGPDRVRLQFTNCRWLRVKRPDGTMDPQLAYSTENLIRYSRNNVADPLGKLPGTNADRLFNYTDPSVWKTTV